MAKDEIKSGKTAQSVRSNGHASSGGHADRSTTASKVAVRQVSALSRVNRIRWDVTDGITGGDMPYQYQEYPKHIYPDPTKPKHFVCVNDCNEERLALGGEEIIDDEHERHRLLTVASVNKIPVDKRWGPAKLTKAIEDAGSDPTLNPFK